MVDVQTVSIVIASASIVAGIIYYGLQIRQQTKTRQTDLILRLYTTASSREVQDSYEKMREREIKNHEDYKKRYGTFVEYNQLVGLYCALGMLLYRKLVDIDLIDDVTGRTVVTLYEKVKPMYESVLKARGMEWDSFRYLYNEMKKREQAGAKSG